MISVGFRFKNLPITQKSIVINAIIMFFWWITFNPGFFSGDSFGILEIVKSGQLSSELTIFWAVLVKIITINGNHPEFATLVFSQIFGVSISIFSNTLFKGKIALWSSAVLCLTPLVGAMGITLWHDIPMTSGFYKVDQLL
jgi:4-amino-4-deoxy-L-arabinose transferase-like glycosyltransferase